MKCLNRNKKNQHIILVQHQKRIHSDFLSGRRYLWLWYDDQQWQKLLPQISGSGRIQEVKWGGQGQGVSIRPESLCPHLRHWSLKLYWWLVSQTIRQSSSLILEPLRNSRKQRKASNWLFAFGIQWLIPRHPRVLTATHLLTKIFVSETEDGKGRCIVGLFNTLHLLVWTLFLNLMLKWREINLITTDWFPTSYIVETMIL